MNRWMKDRLQLGISKAYQWTRKAHATSGHRSLLFHAVGTRLPWDRESIFSVAPAKMDTFFQLLAELQNSGSLRLVKSEEPVGETQLHLSLTFDDGYLDNLEKALPLCEKYSFPFTVFVCLEYMKSGNPLYMNLEQIRELARHPLCSIGSHCVTHRPLPDLSNPEKRSELYESKKTLEDVLDRSISVVAYPHGQFDHETLELAHKSGYRRGFTARGGLNHGSTPNFEWRRTEVLATDSPESFLMKIRGAWDWYGFKSILQGLAPRY